MRQRDARALVAVILLPAIAAAIGLWSMTGRVDTFSHVPAAVVNLDKGAVMDVDGKKQKVPLGRLLAGALTDPRTADMGDMPKHNLDWKLENRKDAAKGLENGTYQAVITIPEDFSARLATNGTKDAEPALITVRSNQASNYITSVMSREIAQVAASRMGNYMTEQMLDKIFIGMDGIREGFDKAADGTDKLHTGTVKLGEGSSQLAAGTRQLADKTPQLVNGIARLHSGAGQLYDGMGRSVSGADQLAGAMNLLASGTGSLTDGLKKMDLAAQQLSGGMAQLVIGLKMVNAGLSNPDPSNPGLKEGLALVSEGLTAYKKGLTDTHDPQSLQSTINNLADGSTQIKDGLGQASTALGVANGKLDVLFNNIDEPSEQQSIGTVVAGVPQVIQAVKIVEKKCPPEPGATLDAATCKAFMDALGNLSSTQMTDGLGKLGTIFSKPGFEDLLTARGYLRGDGTAANPGLVNSLKGLSTKYQQFDGGLQQLKNAPGQLAKNLEPISQGVTAAGNGVEKLHKAMTTGSGTNPGLIPAAQQIAGGQSQLAGGISQMNAQSGQFVDGMHKTAAGANDLASGLGQLRNGTGALVSGIGQLQSGAGQLTSGTRRLADGADQLAGGVGQLQNGTLDLSVGLRQGANGVPSYTHAERADLVKTGARPVKVDSHVDNEAPNDATSSFPLTAALMLWLGAFATFLIMPALRKRVLDSSASAFLAVYRSWWPAAAIAVVHAVIVTAVGFTFGIEPKHMLLAFIYAVLVAIVFATIVQMIMAVFGHRLGSIVTLLFFIVQGASLSGILPLETAPAFYEGFNGYLPLSMANNGLVQFILGGGVYDVAATTAGLALWFVASAIITIAVVPRRRRARFESTLADAQKVPAALA